MNSMIGPLEPRRLLAAFDPSFGDNGLTFFPLGISASGNVVLAQASGKVTVGSTFFPKSGGSAACLVQVNDDGSLNKSFGKNGIVAVPTDILGLAEQDDRVVTLRAGNDYFELDRYTPAGAIDRTFGRNGSVRVNQAPLVVVEDMRALADGSVEAVFVTLDHRLGIARYDTSGKPDLSLGPKGYKLIDYTKISRGSIYANRYHPLAIDTDGSVAVVVEELFASEKDYSDFPSHRGPRVLKFTPRGFADKSFAGDGVADDLAGDNNSLISITFEDHKIVVGGAKHLRSDDPQRPIYQSLIARFDVDGTLDKSFANNGIYRIPGEVVNPVAELESAPNGDVLALVDFLHLYRLAPNGTLRPSYAPAGFDFYGPGRSTNDLAFDSQGRILLVGGTFDPKRLANFASVTRIVDALPVESFLRVLGTQGDDTISVSQSGHGSDRTFVVNRNGKRSLFKADEVAGVVVEAGDGDDRVFVGDNINSTVHGGNGNDRLQGGDGAQVFYGESGNDKIFAGAGDDVIYGGGGKDYVLGEAGSDRLYGGPDKDTIDGGAGDDRLFGQAGDDILLGGAGNDRFDPGAGRDFVNAGDGNDLIFAADGEGDFILGGAGVDSAQFDKHLDELHGIETVL